VLIHLWLGLTLGAIGALVGVTGSVLVFDREIDGALNAQRYATSGRDVALPYADYAQRGARAVGDGALAVSLRIPHGENVPVVAFVRGGGAMPGAASASADGPLRRVYLDPPTGRVLDAPAHTGLIGWAHDFHESLKLHDYNGREIVGIVGIAMLISSLSGIYLWWPRRRVRVADLAFRRGAAMSRNLHLTLGVWGAVVLAMLSCTGIFLAFPDAGRAGVAIFAPVSASTRGVQAPEAVERKVRTITPDDAIAAARAKYAASSVAGIAFPAGPRGVYRVALRELGDDSERGMTVVFIDPRSAAVLRRVNRSSQTRGDAFLAFMRPLHEGESLGLGGRTVIAFVGLLPALFVVTGTMMGLRSRRVRHRRDGTDNPARSATRRSTEEINGEQTAPRRRARRQCRASSPRARRLASVPRHAPRVAGKQGTDSTRRSRSAAQRGCEAATRDERPRRARAPPAASSSPRRGRRPRAGSACRKAPPRQRAPTFRA
jgi:uncharacterized iron-regulated membrane protein